MNKATEDELCDLHALVARELKTQITMKHYRKLGKDADGVTIYEECRCPMSVINQARQFLKDNRIEISANALKKNPDMLQPDDLPFMDEEMPASIN